MCHSSRCIAHVEELHPDKLSRYIKNMLIFPWGHSVSGIGRTHDRKDFEALSYQQGGTLKITLVSRHSVCLCTADVNTPILRHNLCINSVREQTCRWEILVWTGKAPTDDAAASQADRFLLVRVGIGETESIRSTKAPLDPLYPR